MSSPSPPPRRNSNPVWNAYAHFDYEANEWTVVPYLLANGVRLARVAYEPDAPKIVESETSDTERGYVSQNEDAAGSLHVLFEVGDHLGSTSVVLDKATGELVERSTFQAYGGSESDYRPERWGAFREDYKFTGKEEDVEVGLQYFGKRYLNAQLGRWISADPLEVHAPGEADPNVYAYVRAKILSSVDPLGLDDEGIVKVTDENLAEIAAGRGGPLSVDVQAPSNEVPEPSISGSGGHTPTEKPSPPQAQVPEPPSLEELDQIGKDAVNRIDTAFETGKDAVNRIDTAFETVQDVRDKYDELVSESSAWDYAAEDMQFHLVGEASYGGCIFACVGTTAAYMQPTWSGGEGTTQITPVGVGGGTTVGGGLSLRGGFFFGSPALREASTPWRIGTKARNVTFRTVGSQLHGAELDFAGRLKLNRSTPGIETDF